MPPYIGQVDALMATSEGYLAGARQRSDDWPLCGSYLARAVEHAVCAVFMAWGEPYKTGRTVQPHFGERLAPLIDPALTASVWAIWDYEGRGRPADNVDDLFRNCEAVVRSLIGLARNDPPHGWQARPVPPSIAWEDLSDDEQNFLREAFMASRQWCPNVRMLLFGSRASGTARPESDYDLFFIFPDETPEPHRRAATGEAGGLAYSKGLDVDIEKCSDSEWLEPPEASRPLIERVRACHIQVSG